MRLQRLKTAWPFFLLAATLMARPAAGEGITLVRDGAPAGVIVVADKPTEVAKLAAKELQDHLRMISDATLPILKESQAGRAPEGSVRIYVGPSAGTKALGVSTEGMTPEHFIVETRDSALLLLGRDTHSYPPKRKPDPLNLYSVQPGTLFAVYHFLDRALGVRWLWPGELGVYAPRRRTVEVGKIAYRGGPQLLIRHLRPLRSRSYWRRYADRYKGWRFVEPDLRKRLGREEVIWERRHLLGRRTTVRGGHAFTRWWGRYGKTHPEYFATLPKGRKQPYPAPDRAKLCVSNPAVADQVVAEWRAAGKPKLVRISPNDSLGYCVCDRCRAWDAPDRTTPEQIAEGKVQLSNRYVRFWNAVAGKVHAEDPEVVIFASAYQMHREPPKGLRVPPNMYMTCVIGMKKGSWDTWRGWSAAGARLMLRPNWWHYGHCSPYLPLHEAGATFKFACAHGAFGTDFDSLLGHWATQGPFYYLIARLTTRPEMSVDAVIDEYTDAFGPAKPVVREYLAFWERYAPKAFELYKRHAKALRIRSGSRASVVCMPFAYPEPVLAQGEAILRRGLAAVPDTPPNSRYRERLRFLMLGLQHVRLTNAAVLAASGKLKSRREADPTAAVRAANAVIAFRRKHEAEFVDWGEGSTFAELRVGDHAGVGLARLLGGRPPVCALPVGWDFSFDPDRVGEKRRWYARDFNPRRARPRWLRARTDRSWEKQGIGVAWKKKHGRDYDGWAWYRVRFRLPAEEKGKPVSLVFGAVDEDAKVWVNGQYAGAHPFVKPEDWKTPFEIDITRHVRFGKEDNTLAVRVLDNRGAGGIWRPVWVVTGTANRPR